MSQDKDNNGISYATPATWGKVADGCDYDALLESQGRDLTQVDDVVKIHKQHGFTLQNFKAGLGGRHIEDGIDAQNLNTGVIVQDGRIGAGRKGVAITNKGGNQFMTFQRLVICAPYGRWCDLEDGNHSDQVWDKTIGTIYSEIVREDGKPVRYAWGRSHRAELLKGNYRICWGWTLCLHVYVYAKHHFPFIP